MNLVGRLGAAWGAAGILGLLLLAVARLSPRVLDAYAMGLDGIEWTALILFAVFMAYTEGYRGFQLRFSPRTAARVRYLRDRPNLFRSLLGPLFVMGFFHARRRTKIVAYALTTMIVALVVSIQWLAQPWRGIVDAGVVLGLSWGIVTLVAAFGTALGREHYPVSPEVD